MAASPRPPKYRSLDDILEALKNESPDDEPKTEKPDPDKPVKEEEINPLDQDVEVEASEEVEEDKFDDLDSPKEEEKDIPDPYSELKSKYAAQPQTPPPPEPDSPKQDKWASYPEYPRGSAAHATSAEASVPFETNLDDLAEENLIEQAPESENDFSIRRLSPSAPSRVNQDYTPLQRDTKFNYPLEQKNPNKIWKILLLSLIGVITIATVIFLLKNQYIPFIGKASNVVISSPSPTPQATPEPTPTPIPELPRAEFKIRVLNGTTTSGLAASTSAMLKGLGYQIDRIGNNSNQNIAQTTISVKARSLALAQQLARDLSTKFQATTSATPLAPSDNADAQVVLGTK